MITFYKLKSDDCSHSVNTWQTCDEFPFDVSALIQGTLEASRMLENFFSDVIQNLIQIKQKMKENMNGINNNWPI